LEEVVTRTVGLDHSSAVLLKQLGGIPVAKILQNPVPVTYSGENSKKTTTFIRLHTGTIIKFHPIKQVSS
jgi:hypothetical protein